MVKGFFGNLKKFWRCKRNVWRYRKKAPETNRRKFRELLPAPPKGSSIPPKTILIPALPFKVKDKD